MEKYIVRQVCNIHLHAQVWIVYYQLAIYLNASYLFSEGRTASDSRK